MEVRSRSKGLSEDIMECSSEDRGRVFYGIRFFLAGFDPTAEIQYSTELENNGGFNVGQYDASCTHVIVHHLTYDDPICLTARKDKKILVTDWWVADSLDMGIPADPTRIIYRPVKDFGGIPGSNSLCMCLTGYQSQDRSDIMRMVDMMGARFTKPLIAKEVTHLICYKFEGDKYKLAKQMRLKLVNHRWLEDCLKAWTLLPEDNYEKSGWELELLEAQAGDSEDDRVGKIGSPTPSRQVIKQGSLFRSPHKPRGTSSPMPLQINNNKKLDTPKPLPRVCAEVNIDGEQHTKEEYAGVPSRGTPSSTKCDLGALLTKKGEITKDLDGKPKGMQLKEVGHVGLDLMNQEEGTGFSLSAEGKKTDDTGHMALAEQDIPISAARVSNVAYLRKTPMKTGTVDMRTGRNEKLVDFAKESHLVSEMGGDDIKNTPLAVATKAAKGLFPTHSDNVYQNVQPRDGQASEANIQMNLVENATEGKQHSDIDLGRSRLDADDQFKTPLERTTTQAFQDGLSIGSNSGFKKVRAANMGADLSNISINLAEASGTGKFTRHDEEISTRKFISSDSNILLANEEASNLEIGNAVDNVDGNGQKTYNDISESKVLLSRTVTPNANCQLESSVGGKRQKQSKASVPNKRKNTISGGRPMSLRKAIHSKPEVCHKEEMREMELGAEKENMDDGMDEIKTKVSKKSNMPSQLHASENMISKTPNSASASLQSVPTNDNSVLPQKRGRKQGLNKKAAAKNRKYDAEHINLNVPNGMGTTSNPHEDVLADEHGITTDLIHDAAQKSDGLDDHEQQHFEEGSVAAKEFLSKKEVVSLDTSVDKLEAMASNEKPRKRGRPSSKKLKSSELVDKLNPVIRDAEDQEKNKTAAIQGKANCLASTPRSGASITQVGSPNGLDKSDVSSAPGDTIRKPPGSVEQPSHNNRVGTSPYTSDDQHEHCNGSIHNCSNLSMDGNDNIEDAQSLQVSRGHKRKQPVETKDAEALQNRVDELQNNQINNKKKSGANRKTGASKPKKSKCGVNTTPTNEKKALSMFEKSLGSILDDRGKASNVNSVPKDKSGKLTNTMKPTKASKTLRQDFENDAEKKIDVIQATTQETSKIVCHSDPRWFLLSGHRLQRKEFQQLIKSLGGKLLKDSHQWSYKATHLVIPEPLRRTEKFFAAVAAGRWVLTTDYLAASKQAGRFLEEYEYEWHKSGLNEDGTISFEAPRKWRLFRERTGLGAFHGFHIIVYGECIAPTLDTLKRVVKAGGGLILATSPPYNRSLAAGVNFAVISPGIPRNDIWVQEFLRHDVACVLVDYLVEYVCKPTYPLDKHVLFNTHAAVKKFLETLEMNRQSAMSSSLSQQAPTLQSKAHMEVEEEEKKEENVPEITCSICGSTDRDDVMLLCGDEKGRGCGIAMHIDCCQPPMEHVPEEDWFCFKCQPLAYPNKSSKAKQKKPRNS